MSDHSKFMCQVMMLVIDLFTVCSSRNTLLSQDADFSNPDYVTFDLGTESLVEAITTQGYASIESPRRRRSVYTGANSRVKTYEVSFRRTANDAWSFVRNAADSR